MLTASHPEGRPLFGQLITAMVTPFTTSGAVDYGRAEALADDLVASGSDGLVVCGTTGESPTLTWDEEYELFQVVQRAVVGRAKVIAGTGSNATAEAIAATQQAAKLGLDGSLQVVPYYNKPPQEGLYGHFRAIAEATPDLPMLLYNIPGRTGCKLEGTTIARLAEIPNIVGIKEATGDLDLASQIRAHTPPEFAIYSGDDSLTLPLMAVGAQGVVSVASHLVGADLKRCMEAFVAGNLSQAQALHIKLFPLFRALFWNTNPIPLKAALYLLGRDSGVVRSPLVPAGEELLVKLKAVLMSLGLMSE
ncbi:MAG TPA: 4-hydroxy-tetrahydrodipicolinate synthase [Cyanobacteria bacterium UBA8156]|jgi:4-hydroxy-tetrahydrodipicolinate synthase|nr:4-hydroxy-tetrahydrodipicolinate synthase [Cyanobacteria bacterium UBA8156]